MKTNPDDRRCSALYTEVPAGFCGKLREKVTTLRQQLVATYTKVLPGRDQVLRKVINEAEALAWETQFPHLFLPDLAEVRVAEVLAAEASVSRHLA